MDRIPGGFIKANRPFVHEYEETNPAPLFRKRFTLERFEAAEIAVCMLGLGECFINGKPVTDAMHLSPTSDYNKTLWYSRFDVTELLREGENVIACILGNGWYNEAVRSCWNFEDADWRDNPKLALTLYADGKPVLSTDETWLCKPESWITFNQIRSGEHADMRLYDAAWDRLEYDDSAWEQAVKDDVPPKGVFRESTCPYVRVCAAYPAKTVRKTGEKKWLFDIGQNISGVARLKIRGRAGETLTIRYGEQVYEDGSLKLNDMPGFYNSGRFQTDEVILCEGETVYAPRFTYHGFRYVEIEGLETASTDMVEGLFIHSDVRRLSRFECSNAVLNRLFEIGINACWSNMHYILTDCPTREKLGWLNDARASARQLMMNFDMADYFRKWYRDILDSVREDGAVPGIAPTWGWGYDRYTGPICTSALTQIPFVVEWFSGDSGLLIEGLPYMLRHIEYMKTRMNAEGLLEYGLYDWAGPFREDPDGAAPTPVAFTDTALYIEFLRRTAYAACVAKRGDIEETMQAEAERMETLFKAKYLDADGTCRIHTQTAVAMMIELDLYDDLEPLKRQLKACLEEKNGHMHCGMLGIQFLLSAMEVCGMADEAVRMLSAEDYPSFGQWLKGDATTLWETFYEGASKNHHMWSCFMGFLVDAITGLRVTAEHVRLSPMFPTNLDWCEASREMPNGVVAFRWERRGDKIIARLNAPENTVCDDHGGFLEAGEHVFEIPVGKDWSVDYEKGY